MQKNLSNTNKLKKLKKIPTQKKENKESEIPWKSTNVSKMLGTFETWETPVQGGFLLMYKEPLLLLMYKEMMQTPKETYPHERKIK